MSIRTFLITPIALLLALGFAGRELGMFETGATPYGEASAIAAPPERTPTFVSEIGTALTVPPRAPAGLPASGTGSGSSSLLPLMAGLVLAGGGVLLIQAARSIGRASRAS